MNDTDHSYTLGVLAGIGTDHAVDTATGHHSPSVYYGVGWTSVCGRYADAPLALDAAGHPRRWRDVAADRACSWCDRML